MAKLPSSFTSEGKGDMNDFTTIPAGKYTAAIAKSAYKQNSKKTGHYLSLQFKILEGEFKDRVVFANMNLDNPNGETVEIAEKELATLTKACGKVSIDDSEELHGIPVMIKVIVKPATANQAEKNEIKFYEPAKGYKKPSNPESGENTGDDPVRSTKTKRKVSFDDE